MVRNAKILLLCKKNVFKCTTLKEYDHAFFVLEMILFWMIFLFISGVNGVNSENIDTMQTINLSCTCVMLQMHQNLLPRQFWTRGIFLFQKI